MKKKYQSKLAWALFSVFFILGGPGHRGRLGPLGRGPSQNKKNEKNKANGNGNAHANFDWYFLVLFFKIVWPHLAWPHLAFSEKLSCQWSNRNGCLYSGFFKTVFVHHNSARCIEIVLAYPYCFSSFLASTSSFQMVPVVHGEDFCMQNPNLQSEIENSGN